MSSEFSSIAFLTKCPHISTLDQSLDRKTHNRMLMHFEICAICGEQSRDNPRQWTPTPYSWIAVKSDQSPSLSLSQFYYSYFPNSDIAVVLVYCYFTQKKYNVKFIFINFLLSLRNLLTKYDGKWMAAFCFAFINNSLTHMFLVFFGEYSVKAHIITQLIFCFAIPTILCKYTSDLKVFGLT